MPVDNVSVRREGKEEQWWLAKKNCRFSAQTLFDGPWGAIVPADVTDGLDVEYDDAHGQVANVRRYVPLPESTRRIVMLHGCDHPGIALDKFVYRYGDQKLAKPSLHQVIAVNDRLVAASHSMVFEGLRARWRTTVGAGCAPTCFVATTIGPLTLHLARASALENAGICLHPLYGFVYLPGSGLKGMARAFAETVWLDSQPDRRRAWMQIEDVFGWAATRERKEQIHNTEHPAQARRDPPDDTKGRIIDSSAGQIVFHDAWPTAWPKLIVDIANSHHSDYYSAREGDNGDAPGDWEGPIPIYFLAVAPGATFEFVVAKRRGDVGGESLALAREWLSGALVHLGAGAKTAAGYGAFRLPDAPDAGTGGTPTAAPATRASDSAIAGSSRRSFTTTLELITPAFLAGANQKPEDCDLRPATLRGLLRWWWRTLHAGHVDVATLRRMEAAIWGDTKQGSPVRIVVEPNANNQPAAQYDKKAVKAEFPPAEKKGAYGIPGAVPEKTTQGLWYASFGMDDAGKKRWYLPRGSRWELRLASRRAAPLSAEQVLDQAKAAIWLLCHYGGVGAKSGKGFGSLACALDSWSLERCLETARAARMAVGVDGPLRDQLASSPAIGQRMQDFTTTFAWSNVWDVLDQVGFALQAFAKTYAHQREKKALGLPRKIGRTGNDAAGNFRPTGVVGEAGAKARHSAPYHIHLASSGGGYLVRLLTMPAAHLPDLATSRAFLQKFRDSFAAEMTRRAALSPPADKGRARSSSTSRRSPGPIAVATPPVSDWEQIEASYLRKIGNTHLVELADGTKTRIQYGIAPSAPKPGDKVTVYRQKSGPRECRWQPPGGK